MRENLLIFLPWLSLPLPMASRWSPIPDCFLLSYFFVLIHPLPSHLFSSHCFLSHSTSPLSLHLLLISAFEPSRRLCLPPGLPVRAPSPQQPPLGRTQGPLLCACTALCRGIGPSTCCPAYSCPHRTLQDGKGQRLIGSHIWTGS